MVLVLKFVKLLVFIGVVWIDEWLDCFFVIWLEVFVEFVSGV